MRNFPWLSSFAAAWACLVWLPPTEAADWYVGPTGSNANPGTAALPFREIRRALTSATAPGSTIHVADGSYLGFDMEDFTGTAAAPISIVASGANAVVVKTTDRSDNRDTIYVNNCFHVVIDGLRSFSANRAALRVQDGAFVTIRRCVFGDNTRWGILTGQSPDLLIEDNECYGSQIEHGIYVANSGDRPVVRRNRVHDNHNSGIQLNADFNTPPGDGIITGALIEGNVIYNNGVGGGGALNLDGVQDSLIRNNLFYNNLASGIIMFMIDGAEGPRGNRVIHNTVDMPSGGRWALSIKNNSVQNASQRNFVRDNILLQRNPTVRGGLLFGTADDAANTDSDYNIVNHISDDDGDENRYTLAEWKASGHEPHSSTGAPATLFIDDVQHCYLLKSGAAALNTGIALSDAGADYEGRSRLGLVPDPGCYEQGPLSLVLETSLSPTPMLTLGIRAGTTAQCQLSTSPDLATWTPWQTLTRDDHRLVIPIQPGTPAQLFYRASQ